LVETAEKIKPKTRRRPKSASPWSCGPNCVFGKPPTIACPCCGTDISYGVSQMLRVIQKGKGQFIYTRRGGKVMQFCLKCAQIITGVRNRRGRLLDQYKETPWVMFPKC
jgi:hypothetical protein